MFPEGDNGNVKIGYSISRKAILGIFDAFGKNVRSTGTTNVFELRIYSVQF